MTDQAALFDSATKLQRAMALLSRRLMTGRPPSGLSASKLSVLALLQREGQTRASALAAHLRIQPQSLTRLLGDLVRRKLIARRADPADGRASLIELTALGARHLRQDAQRRRAVLAQAMAKLSLAEHATLDRAAVLLDRLAGAVEATRPGRDAA